MGLNCNYYETSRKENHQVLCNFEKHTDSRMQQAFFRYVLHDTVKYTRFCLCFCFLEDNRFLEWGQCSCGRPPIYRSFHKAKQVRHIFSLHHSPQAAAVVRLLSLRSYIGPVFKLEKHNIAIWALNHSCVLRFCVANVV